MKPDHMPPSAPTPAVPAGEPRPRERGQAMVEFAAVLLPVLLIVVGIIQFGLLFGANVTLTNAVRESGPRGHDRDLRHQRNALRE